MAQEKIDLADLLRHLGLGHSKDRNGIILSLDTNHNDFVNHAASRDYIERLAKAVDIIKKQAPMDVRHLTVEQLFETCPFLKEGIPLHPNSLDYVFSLDLPSALTQDLAGKDYDALRHLIRDCLIKEAHRLLLPQGRYIAVERAPHVDYPGLYGERIFSPNGNYSSTIFKK